MPALLDTSFLFVVGKGGVGKTTVTAAIAVAAAKRGKRVLVAMTNAKERLSTLLGTEPIGATNQTIAPNIDAVNMIPQVALEEYGLMVLKSRTLQRAIFENRIVTGLLRNAFIEALKPGVEDTIDLDEVLTKKKREADAETQKELKDEHQEDDGR